MLEFEKLEQFEQDQEQDLLSEEGSQLEPDTPAADLPEDWAELMDDDEALLPNEEDDIDGTEQAPETEEKPKRRSRKKKDAAAAAPDAENGDFDEEEQPEPIQEPLSPNAELPEDASKEDGSIFPEDAEQGELTGEVVEADSADPPKSGDPR